MRFKGFDLNMLVVLDCLLTERSVTRAGEKLFRSQSTVSGVLARLREHFDDELLVQVGRELVPTARGRELAAEVRDVLMQIDARVLTPRDFDPTRSARTIRIFASDYLMIAGLGDAILAIQARAPNLQFEVVQPTQMTLSHSGPAQMLEDGELDLLAIPQPYCSPQHPSLPLFTESFCALVCRNNPLVGEQVALDAFLSLRHVTVSFGPGAQPSYEEWFSREYGEGRRRIDIVAGSFASMPFLLPGTERIALAHRQLARVYTRVLPLRIVEVEMPIPPLVEAIQWHQYASKDRAMMWVRDEMVHHFGSGIET
ncbi:LysR family transcriptional regulator [Natronohydrobacter thiooxidans]|uniref:LysR family transcriptional regulator n=1 Tax=Natronohydrobacter thiooxidans TaxID=87172 RepID=UPI0008FF6E22|nr:LysR family transcriptional regulator [Natronohydrobacter thiooxidans]